MTGDLLPADCNFFSHFIYAYVVIFQTSFTFHRLDVEGDHKSKPTKREQVHVMHTHSLAATGEIVQLTSCSNTLTIVLHALWEKAAGDIPSKSIRHIISVSFKLSK